MSKNSPSGTTSESVPASAPSADEPLQVTSDYIASERFADLPLSAPVLASIAARGYEKPTPVQAAVLRPILDGRDLIVRSKTGTGKTAAFGIPLVEAVDAEQGAVQALVLCNTRELALQVSNEISDLGKDKGVSVVAIYGGASMDAQVKKLAAGAHIAVGTPGRILDLLERKTLSLKQTRLAVLDEADEMLGMGFYEDVMKILGKLPKKHQTLLFSATISPEIEHIVKTHLKEPETILLSGDTFTVEGITNVVYFAQDAYPKPRNLLYMLQLEAPDNAIIFCNTRDDVNLVATVLDRNGYDAERLSGELPQKERERVMAKIKRGEVQFMVATDLAARGIDISDLSHVINYSLPEDPAVYLHRIGRTGRIGKSGTALSLVRGTELVTLSALQKRYGIGFDERKLPTPEEARKLWTKTHVTQLRKAMGTLLFDAYVPLAQELRKRDDGDLLVAFALKYFFTHHRKELLAAQAKEGAQSKGADGRQESSGRAGDAQEKEEARSRSKTRKKTARDDRPAAEERPAAKDQDSAKPQKSSEKQTDTSTQSAPKKAAAKKKSAAKTPAANTQTAADTQPASEAQGETKAAGAGRRPKKVRLFVNIGSEQGVDEGSLREGLAALAGLPQESVLKVDQKQTHSFVEVEVGALESFLGASGESFHEVELSIERARPRRRR